MLFNQTKRSLLRHRKHIYKNLDNQYKKSDDFSPDSLLSTFTIFPILHHFSKEDTHNTDSC